MPQKVLSSLLRFNSNWSQCCCFRILFCKIYHTLKKTTQLIRKFLCICLLLVLIKGKLVMVFQINAPLRYKMIWSESKSKKFDCQLIFVSFLFKLNQLSREAKLTCPLLRPQEDISLGIRYSIVTSFQRMTHLAIQSVSMFEKLVGKHIRLRMVFFFVFLKLNY